MKDIIKSYINNYKQDSKTFANLDVFKHSEPSIISINSTIDIAHNPEDGRCKTSQNTLLDCRLVVHGDDNRHVNQISLRHNINHIEETNHSEYEMRVEIDNDETAGVIANIIKNYKSKQKEAKS